MFNVADSIKFVDIKENSGTNHINSYAMNFATRLHFPTSL